MVVGSFSWKSSLSSIPIILRSTLFMCPGFPKCFELGAFYFLYFSSLLVLFISTFHRLGLKVCITVLGPGMGMWLNLRRICLPLLVHRTPQHEGLSLPIAWRSILAHHMEVCPCPTHGGLSLPIEWRYTLAHMEIYSCHCTVEETELRASFAAGHRANEWKGYTLASSPAWNLVSEGQQRPALRPIIYTVPPTPHAPYPTPHAPCLAPPTPQPPFICLISSGLNLG